VEREIASNNRIATNEIMIEDEEYYQENMEEAVQRFEVEDDQLDSRRSSRR